MVIEKLQEEKQMYSSRDEYKFLLTRGINLEGILFCFIIPLI